MAVKDLNCTIVADRCTSEVVWRTTRFGPLPLVPWALVAVHLTTDRSIEKLRAALQSIIEQRTCKQGRLAKARGVLRRFTQSRTARISEVVTFVVEQAAKNREPKRHTNPQTHKHFDTLRGWCNNSKNIESSTSTSPAHIAVCAPIRLLSSSGQCASAAPHGNLKPSHTPRGIGARADPDVPHTTMERRASCSVHQPERNCCERSVFGQGPDSSFGGMPSGILRR